MGCGRGFLWGVFLFFRFQGSVLSWVHHKNVPIIGVQISASSSFKGKFSSTTVFGQVNEDAETERPKFSAADTSLAPTADELIKSFDYENDVEEAEKVEDDEDSAFVVLAGNIANCLHKSDLKRDDGFDGASTGWTSWVDAAAALRLQSCIDAVELSSFIRKRQQNLLPEDVRKRDDAIRWIRWIKACPSPLIVEMSEELRQAVNATIPNKNFLREIDSSREEFLQRIGCRLMLLPSGASFVNNLRAPPGSMIYGKLLLGGVTRFRMIGSQRSKRRAGARTLITSPQTRRTPSWLQYGGPERNYEAIDAGPCAFMEVLILPKGLTLPLLMESKDNNAKISLDISEHTMEMTIAQMKWNIHEMLELVSGEEDEDLLTDESQDSSTTNNISQSSLLMGKDYVDHLESAFTVSVGGLQPQIDSIVRRVLDGRVVASTEIARKNDNHSTMADKLRREEMNALLGFRAPTRARVASLWPAWLWGKLICDTVVRR
jgi:hypothetical protein